jgi:hypothetical protein
MILCFVEKFLRRLFACIRSSFFFLGLLVGFISMMMVCTHSPMYSGFPGETEQVIAHRVLG